MQTLLCPTCGGPVPASDDVCGECGTPLPPTAQGGEIRRFATVVNSDLKGSTALGERLDPESLREVLTLYFDEMRAVFESHGGTIEKIIGDAIVAVFAGPVGHEDDALRAVVAAAESQRALVNLNDRLERAWGVRLVVRTGIATGDVVFGEETTGQHVLTGDTMRISSAMEQHAPPLGVLLADSTYELVRDQVEVEAADPVRPKGVDVAVRAYQLLGVEPQAEGAQRDGGARTGIRVCPACGEENPETFQVCAMCGASLDVVTPIRESRKTVTLVFADPKPTTLDGAPPSPEALRDVMTRYFDIMRLALEHHGGTVEKFIGDAVMAVYGMPVRHEDDALRAIRAAADMQAALPALNDEFRARWGVELRNHIGVNTGEVIAGDASLGQRLVTGDAVNTAARLEQAAGAQEIILGELTYRLARDHVGVEPIEPLTLKGKAEPVPAYRLLEVRDRPAERQAQATPFVGRAAELERLREALADAVAHRSARLVTVIGEAGVGKSRLIREFARSKADDASVVRGRCLPYGDGITFWPIGEIVRGAARIDDDDDARAAVAKVVSMIATQAQGADDSEAIAERVGAAIGLSNTTFPMPELFWGIRKLLEAMARSRPLVAIVDDIHAAAPAFLELLDHLLEAAVDAPILLLATARHELVETHSEWAAAHEAGAIALQPLTAAHAVSIVEQLLAGLDPEVQARIIASAEGNPLFVEQITSMLVETGAIRREHERWVPAGTGEVPIPPTVEALVAARLDALGPRERAVIEPASVIGLSFPRDAVQELIDAPLRPSLPDQLASLTAKQLVRRSTGGDEEMFRFGHLTIKDTTYGSLLKRVRASLHQQFVDWAERVNRERGRETEFEEIHGYHLEQAYRYLTELGPADERSRELGRRAAAKLASAGRRAFDRGDAASAAPLLTRATAVLPPDDPTRAALLPTIAEALIELGEFDRAGTLLEEATARATDSGDRGLRMRAQLTTYQLNLGSSGSAGSGEDVVAALDEVIRGFEEVGDDLGVARASHLLSVLYGTAGSYDQAAETAERIVGLASRAGDSRLTARGVLDYVYATLHGSTPVDEARQRCEQYLGLVGGNRLAQAIVLGVLAQLQAMDGRFDEARATYHESRSLIADLGPSSLAATTSLEASRVEMLAGNPAAAERELRRDYEVLEGMGETYFRSTIAALLAHALWAQGGADEAAKYADIARELADEDDVLSQVAWRTVRAKVDASTAPSDRAIDLAREAVRIAANTRDIELQADALLDLAEVAGILGHETDRVRPLEDALDLYTRKGDRVLAAVARSRLEDRALLG